MYIQIKIVEEIADNVIISFAPGMLYCSKGLEAIAPIISKANVIFLNRDEIELLTGRDFKSGALHLLNMGCGEVVITFGKGIVINNSLIVSYIHDNNNEYMIKSQKYENLPILDTTGAGDAFASGFLYGLLKCKGINESGLIGDIMARFAISEKGARRGLPTLSKLDQKYKDLSGFNL